MLMLVRNPLAHNHHQGNRNNRLLLTWSIHTSSKPLYPIVSFIRYSKFYILPICRSIKSFKLNSTRDNSPRVILYQINLPIKARSITPIPPYPLTTLNHHALKNKKPAKFNPKVNFLQTYNLMKSRMIGCLVVAVLPLREIGKS
jgi:hypothetical protein